MSKLATLAAFSLSAALVAAPSLAAAQDVSLSETSEGGVTMGGGGGDWDAKFGGIPRGATFTGELGFSNMPKLGYHMGLSPTFEIGGAFAFDLGYYSPDAAVTAGILLSVPMRLSLSNQNRLSMALLFEPGIAMQFANQFLFGLMMNAGFNAGYSINNQFKIGGGIDLPIALVFTPDFALVLPILFGPVLEIHANPQLAITFDAKFGPHIVAADFGRTGFGMKLNVGLAYRFN